MMNTLLIKNTLLGGRKVNVLVAGNKFECLDASASAEAATVIDGEGTAILPAMYNTHNHAAMTLLRGYGSDKPLKEWLEDYIWPYEATMTPDDIQKGSEIAVREMVSSGSVFFNDMYFEIDRTIDVVAKAGMRASIGVTVMENHSLAMYEEKMKMVRNWTDPTGGRITLAMAPHAIYTVGAEKLCSSAAFARENGLKLHIHVSETKGEVEDCIRDHGMSPVRYLDSLGFLGPDVIAAHCVWVDKEEWDILAERGVTVSHCPCSNMKLGSGRFPYELALKSGVKMSLGTDGASSNNNLDLREEMKFAALLAKSTGDTTLLSSDEIFRWATRGGAEAFGIDAGEIAVGKLADFILVDMTAPRMTPCHDLVANWVYAADSSCVKAVFCDGKLIQKS